MPYKIRDTGRPGPKRYAIVRADTGEVKAHTASKKNAHYYIYKAEQGDRKESK